MTACIPLILSDVRCLQTKTHRMTAMRPGNNRALLTWLLWNSQNVFSTKQWTLVCCQYAVCQKTTAFTVFLFVLSACKQWDEIIDVRYWQYNLMFSKLQYFPILLMKSNYLLPATMYVAHTFLSLLVQQNVLGVSYNNPVLTVLSSGGKKAVALPCFVPAFS